jgi:manganese efflux pump family protein
LTIFEIAALALALAIDAFSVATSTAPRAHREWGPVRMAASFGLFQAVMPLLGALVGAYLLVYVHAYDHWIAFGILTLVGLKMIVEALKKADETGNGCVNVDPSRGFPLIALSVATSIDAFGAGVGMQIVGANLWIASPVIGIVCAILTYLGAKIGTAAAHHFGQRAEIVGGLVLIGLGVKMLAM